MRESLRTGPRVLGAGGADGADGAVAAGTGAAASSASGIGASSCAAPPGSTVVGSGVGSGAASGCGDIGAGLLPPHATTNRHDRSTRFIPDIVAPRPCYDVAMRPGWLVLVAVVLLRSTLALAAPTKKQYAELTALDQEVIRLQTTQASFAAAKVARRAYDLARKVWGEDDKETHRRLSTLAGLLQQTNDHAAALAMYGKLLAFAEKQHGRESREAQAALGPMLGPLWAQGRLAEVEPLAQRMLALSRKLDGEHSHAYAAQLLSYGGLLQSRNQWSSAQRIYEQALKVHQAISKGPDDLTPLSTMQLLAGVYAQTEQWPKATALYAQVIALVDKSPTANVMMKAGTLWGIAAAYHYGGRDAQAAPLRTRAIKLYEQEIARLEKAKPDDLMLSALYGQLGFNLRTAGDLVAADKALSRAVALDEQRGGFSGWASSLAEIKRAQGHPREALALLERAQAGLAKVAPQSATAFNTMIADVLRELGEFPRAEQLLAAHLAHLAKIYGTRHPVYGMTQMSAATVYMSAGKLAPAEKMLGDALDSAERELQLVLQTGTEADHTVYFARNAYHLNAAISFHLDHAPKRASAARLALTTLLRRKGRALDAAAASLATIRARLSPADKQLLDDLASARAKLSRLMVAGPTATGQADYAKEIAALEDQIQKLEVSVGKKSAAYRVVTQPITFAAVQQMIPRTARLVEIVSVEPIDPKAPYQLTPKRLPRHYVAYVTARKGDPVAVDLGSAAAIDDAIAKFRKALADPRNPNVVALGRALHDLTMAKITPALGGATELLVAPDGALNVVPFSALVDGQQEFLIKRFTFTYLTSGRDLLRLRVKGKAQGGGVLFADPAFDAKAGKPKPASQPTRGLRSSDLASLAWPRLPGTAEEATAIEQRIAGLTVYRGARATETALKKVHSPRILHLATHGFFLPDAPPAAVDPTSPTPAAGAPSAPRVENPLLRSGLAFAGANQLVSGDDDGILTALEATGLDLWGTKLVVLSACETGVGKVTNGDGVYGLRRALVIAGAESLVMSLWQVDDAATKELMTGYYTRLGAGKPRSSALRDVQLELLGTKAYAHPFYWASFLPAGDTAPLGR